MALKVSRRNTLLASIGILFPSVALGVIKKKGNNVEKGHLANSSVLRLNHQKKKIKSPAYIGNTRPALPMVVLDPGHGGRDPGAIGYSGTYEKHVAYATAVELANLFRCMLMPYVTHQFGVQVFIPYPITLLMPNRLLWRLSKIKPIVMVVLISM